jgi:putative oxygen-independent coproporphyrinogen III oxidase
LAENWQRAGFGLYVHWPFCMAKCPYCDFNSHVAAEIDESRWNRAYLSEIARVGRETGGRVLSTVFFGGGTPSLMSPDLVGAILEEVRGTWVVANDFEVTLEANPTSVEAGRFRGYRDAGVNRVSVGIQALNDADLKALGRMHSVAEARAAFGLAREVFDRVSFDLIYARQEQSLAAWRVELREALAMAADHLSLYQLTIEDGTAFGDRFRRGRLRGLPEEDLAADMYLLTQEMTEAAGLPGYEVSNHARPGAESRHNLIYWRSGDWAGIGPGAHGRLTVGGVRVATETPLSPLGWLRQVETTGSGEGGRECVEAEDARAEAVMMGLRLAEGVEVEALPDEKYTIINSLCEEGLVLIEEGRLRATAEGRLVLNRITGALLA